MSDDETTETPAPTRGSVAAFLLNRSGGRGTGLFMKLAALTAVVPVVVFFAVNRGGGGPVRVVTVDQLATLPEAVVVPVEVIGKLSNGEPKVDRTPDENPLADAMASSPASSPASSAPAGAQSSVLVRPTSPAASSPLRQQQSANRSRTDAAAQSTTAQSKTTSSTTAPATIPVSELTFPDHSKTSTKYVVYSPDVRQVLQGPWGNHLDGVATAPLYEGQPAEVWTLVQVSGADFVLALGDRTTCLTSSPASALTVAPCDKSDRDQQFHLVMWSADEVGTGIVSVATGKCLTARPADYVRLTGCSGVSGQHFQTGSL